MREMKDSGIKWIGEIPVEWAIEPLFTKFTEGKNKNKLGKERNLLSLSYGKIIRKDIDSKDGLIPENYNGYNIVSAGDIIIRPTDLQNDKRSLRTGLVRENGIITSAYIDLKPTFAVESRYYHYLLHAYDECKVFYNMGNGVRQGINYSLFSKLPVIVPGKNIQGKIADYLDSKCSKIDAIIEKQQAIIEKLKEYKLSVITEAVTKGMNPDVEMKDSGISWIGTIPADWEVVPLKKQLRSIVDYRGKTPKKTLGGIFLVTAKNIKNGIIDYELSKEYVSSSDYDEIMHRGIPEIGDVLFTTEAPLGQVANVDRTDIALAQRIIKFQTKEDLNPYYLKYWIMSTGFQQFLMTLSTGSTATGIKASKLFMLPLVKANKDDQDKIVNFLDNKIQQIEEMINSRSLLSEKMKEYKKSLIYEVVTGKKEV